MLAAEASPAADVVGPAAARRRRDGVATVALALVALAPVLVVVGTRTGRSYLPVQDIAVIDLRVRDVFTSDTPLTGAYSRLGWSHPGPLLYQLLAPLSWLSGGAAWATLVGAAALQGAATSWIAVVAWRRGQLPLVALWLAVVALACGATGPYLLLEAWNPHVALPAFVLVMLLSWTIATGDDHRLPGLVFAGSFVVQAHIGYAPLVAAVGAWALLRRRADLHACGRRVRDVAPVRRTTAVAAVVWAAPVLENVVRRPGNGYEIARAFLLGGGQGEPAGPVQGVGLLAAMFRLPPPWAGGNDLVDPLVQVARPASPAWLLIPVALAVAAWRCTRPDPTGADRRLVELSVLVFVVGALAMTRVTGDATPYLFYWRLVIGPFSVLAPLWVVVRWAQPPRSTLRIAGGAVLALAVLVPSLVLARDVADHPADVMPFEGVARTLLDQAELPRGPTLVRIAGSPLGGVQGGIVDELDRRGVDVRVEPRRPYPFGRDRLGRPASVDTVWYVVEEGRYLSLLTRLPGAEVVARISALSPEDEAELVELQRRMAAILLDRDKRDLVGQLDAPLATFALQDVAAIEAADRDRLTELLERASAGGRCRCAIVAFPPDQAPCNRAVRRHTPADDLADTCRGRD